MNPTMKKIKQFLGDKKQERGQSIVIIAAAFIGLLAFVGLTVDAGVLYISYGHLRRATDSAALAAATQFRENYTYAQLDAAATEYLRLNGTDMDDSSAEVFTCDGDGAGGHIDSSLCVTPKRKLVRVVATNHVSFSFLPIIGIYGTDITAEASGEAASLDVVLVIDISESMSYDFELDDSWGRRDPNVCNNLDPAGTDPAWGDPPGSPDWTPGECQPFEKVKVAAKSLAQFVLNKPIAEEEDRLGLVIFSNGWESGTYKGTYSLAGNATGGWFTSSAAAVNAINALQMYDPMYGPSPRQCSTDDINGTGATPQAGLCSRYDGPGNIFNGTWCPLGADQDWPDPANPYRDFSTCTTTNIGGGMKIGAGMFGTDPHVESVWVEILLTDGAANATCFEPSAGVVNCTNPPDLMNLPIPYCSNADRDPVPAPAPAFNPDGPWWVSNTQPFCRDSYVITRHSPMGSTEYDADDYARDSADFAGCPSIGNDAVLPTVCNGQDGNDANNFYGQGAEIFTIGLGNAVISPDENGVAYGDSLLRYMANATSSLPGACSSVSIPSPLASYHCGNYYFSENGTDLLTIFDDIASKIFTRITE